MNIRILSIPVTVAALGCLAACATEGPPPNEQLTRAHTLVEQADKAGAQRYAAADLQRAHDELTAADQAEAARHYNEARSDAESAAVDADLASARSSAGEAQRAAQEVAAGTASTRSEANRAADTPPPAPIVVTPAQ